MSAPTQVVLAGTGKMARDVGAWLLRNGFRVGFVGRDAGRLRELERKVERDLRRHMDEEIPVSIASATFHRFGEPLPTAEVVIECVVESLEAKRSALDSLIPAATADSLVLSTSSSILPSAIHPRCAAVHFFYPLELTGFVELIVPLGVPAAPIEAFVHALGLKTIAQAEAHAFAVNRLFLPVQARCVAALRAGAPAAEVDSASKSHLLPVGQLSLMDVVGLDTIGASVSSYLARLSEAEANQLAPLRDGVLELVKMGKLGQKNGDGFLCGRPLPWAAGGSRTQKGLGDALARLFDESCRRFVAEGEMTQGDLRLALSGLFGVEWTAR